MKQAIRNKPIRFGFKAWCLATPAGYLITFDFYQGKGSGVNSAANCASVGAAGATLLDLLDLLPDEKKNLPFHIYGDNFFSSQKLVDVLVQNGYNYTGTIRKDRIKGSPPSQMLSSSRRNRGAIAKLLSWSTPA